MNTGQQYKVNGVQYRQQYRRCGKPGCKCNTGEGHGPYWYSYDGMSPAKYVGSKLPESVTKHLELLKKCKPQIKKVRREVETQRDNAWRQYQRACSQIRALDALEASEKVARGDLVDLGLVQLAPVD